VVYWWIQPFGHNGCGPNIAGGGACPFWAELDPHLTQCGLRWGLPPRQVSFWSIQPIGHNTPTLQTGQTGQRSDSIGRTVLQTVIQKPGQTYPWPDPIRPSQNVDPMTSSPETRFQLCGSSQLRRLRYLLLLQTFLKISSTEFQQQNARTPTCSPFSRWTQTAKSKKIGMHQGVCRQLHTVVNTDTSTYRALKKRLLWRFFLRENKRRSWRSPSTPCWSAWWSCGCRGLRTGAQRRPWRHHGRRRRRQSRPAAATRDAHRRHQLTMGEVKFGLSQKAKTKGLD